MEKTVNITNFIGVYDNYITKEECNKAIKLYEDQNKFNNTVNRIGFEKASVLQKQDQQFLKYFEGLVPLLQGNTFLNYFDKEYNAKASELRQTLHARYIKGLFEGLQVNDLLSYTSENYIAKDIKNYLPKTSDLGSIIVEMAAENNSTIDGSPRIEGESAEQYLKRIEKKIDIGDENSQDLISSLDKNQDVRQVGFLGDFFLGKDSILKIWNIKK